MSKDNLSKLKSEWDKKLVDSGFKDIEDSSGRIKNLVSSRYIAGQNNGKQLDAIVLDYSIKEQYYRMASSFLYDHQWSAHLDKLLWWYHSEGLSIADINDIMDDLGIKGMGTPSSVQRKLDRIKTLMLAENKKYNGTAE